MSRGPRKPQDPQRHPEPCARCGAHYAAAARWPDGKVCGYCYQAAKRSTGTCACGHTGVLPGRIDGHPACRECSGVTLNVDCASCGDEAELHSSGRCWRCVFIDDLDAGLTDPTTGAVAATLRPLAQALRQMPRPNSGLTWIRQSHVQTFLRQLVAEPTITHERLDSLTASRTREHVRALLVAHGILPRRDELLARYTRWSRQALARVTDSDHRDVAERFVRWHMLRRMNQMDTVTHGTFLRSKQTVTVAIELLNWLTARQTPLPALSQTDLDEWQATGPSTRELASRFLRWAIKTRVVDAHLAMTPHRRGTSPRLSAADQRRALDTNLHGPGINTRDRLAAVLVLIFGQQMEDVARLTWNQVTLGDVEIGLPDPLDTLVRTIAAAPSNSNTAAHPNSPWVFRGRNPGQHINPAHLRQRMNHAFRTRDARLGTLHEMTRDTPIAILAEALGYSPATIEHHAVAANATYANYIGAVRASRQPGTPTAPEGQLPAP